MSLLVNNVINSSSQISYSYLESEEVFGYLVAFNYTLKVEDVLFDNNDGVLQQVSALDRNNEFESLFFIILFSLLTG